MNADELLCPDCGGEPASGEAAAGGARKLTCGDCGATWLRVPQPVCTRCSSTDVVVAQVVGWQSDDLVEAREDPMHGYDDVIYDEYRCRRCQTTWRHETGRREGRSGEAFRPPSDRKLGRDVE